MEFNQNNNNMDMGQMQRKTFQPEEKNSGSWLWLIVGIIVLGLAAWFVFGAGDSNNIVDDVNSDPVLETNANLEGDIEYDERGLPILGPDAPISNTQMVVQESFPVQVSIMVQGELPDGCTYLNQPVVLRDGRNFYASLTTYQEGEVCTQALVPYERNISLNVDGLPAGNYSVDINGIMLEFDIEQNNSVDFEAGSDK